jgi:hypothetical protein
VICLGHCTGQDQTEEAPHLLLLHAAKPSPASCGECGYRIVRYLIPERETMPQRT